MATVWGSPASGGSFVLPGLELPKDARLPIIIERLPEDGRSIGLSEELIRTNVELRLRRNGLQPLGGAAALLSGFYIHIQVNVLGPVYSVNVGFARDVSYTVSGKTHSATGKTWDKHNVGTHGGDPRFIVGIVADLVDMLSNDIYKTREKGDSSRSGR